MRLSIRSRLLVYFLVPTALGLTVLSFVSYRVARRIVERSLGDRLVSVALAVSEVIQPADARFLQPGDEDTRSYARVRRKLRSLREATGVRRIVLFDPEGRALADSEGHYPIGARVADLARDRLEVEATLAGTPSASTVLFEGEDGRLYKSGYAPLRDGDEVVAGVLVDGSAEFFEALGTLSRSMALVSVLALLGVVGTSLLVARTLARPIRRLAQVAERIGAGDLETRVDFEARTDEVGVLARTLEEMRSALLARERQLQMMLGGIAHEVRNPLGGIELFSGLLAEEIEDGSEAMAHVRRIQRELNHLKRLVEEFLDYARERTVEKEPVDLGELLFEIAQLAGPDAAEKDVELSVEAADATVQADAHLLRGALLNLVRNAVQASPAGGTVRLGAEVEAGEVLLRVEDEGEGVPPEHRERIFEPFFTTREKGSGLGLALVAKAAEVHAGSVRVGEAEGGGARFELRLPRVEAGGEA